MVKQHGFDINKLLANIQKDAVQTVPFCDQLLIGYSLKEKIKNFYASAKEMRYMKMRIMRYSMNVSSMLLILFSLIYGGLNFMGGLSYKQESEASKNKANFYQVRYDLARERLPKTPVEPAQIKVAVDAVATLEDYKSSPYEMMSLLGKTLEQYPGIKLDQLSWSFSMDPNMGMKAKENMQMDNISSDSESEQVKYYQISEFDAHIEPFDGNYREAISMVNDFAETLRSHDETYSVSIESFPLDISSDATLQGNAQVTDKTALFSLRAVIEVN